MQKSATLKADASGHTLMSAQALLSVTSGHSGWTRIKESGMMKLTRKWPRRFVVLHRDTAYVFDDEESRAPKRTIMLEGYKGVLRCNTKVHDWCFLVDPGMEDLKPVKFACVSDRDRLTWMAEVKKLLYVANRISEPGEARMRRMSNASEGGDLSSDYIQLEEPVFTPFVSPSANGASYTAEDDDDDLLPGQRPISDVSTNSNVSAHSSTSSGSNGSVFLPAFRKKSMQNAHLPQAHVEHLVKVQRSKSSPQLPRSLPPPMPCRRQVVSDYVNIPSTSRDHDNDDDEYIYPPSLLEQCSMIGDLRSREELISALREREIGTYLIRNSRKDANKVLVINTGTTDGVKELKIHNSNRKFTLDMIEKFDSFEELLKYYTISSPVPRADTYLKNGFNKEPENEHVYNEAG